MAELRVGGLAKPPKGQVCGVFTALMTVAYLDVLLLMLFPFAMHRNTDSLWIQPQRMGYIGFAIGFSLLFGFALSVLADRRGRTPWWFLGGHFGAFAAPFVAAMGWAESAPTMAKLISLGLCTVGSVVSLLILGPPKLDSFPKPDPLTSLLGRFWYVIGNIWVGIVVMTISAVALYWGTWWESAYGSKSAYHVFYTSTWFGVVFVVFSAALISANLRKYPWRIDQAGWLTVHAALVLIIIGSFISFWGKVEGFLSLFEGESSKTFSVSTETRLQVFELDDRRSDRVKIWEAIADFDIDPSETEPNRTYKVEDRGNELFSIQVERYYGHCTPKKLHTNDGDEPYLAVSGNLRTPMGDRFPITLTEGRTTPLMDSFSMEVRSGLSPESLEAMLQSRDRGGYGRLIVKNAEGEELLVIKVNPTLREDFSGPGTLSFSEEIPGTGIVVSGLEYFDQWTVSEEQSTVPIDASPGMPTNPALSLRLEGPKGRDERFAFAWYPHFSKELGRRSKAYQDLELIYDFVPTPPGLLRLTRGESGKWIYAYEDGNALHTGDVSIGEAIPIGKTRMTFVAEGLFDRFQETESREFVDYRPDRQSVKLNVIGANLAPTKEHWLDIGGRVVAVKDERRYLITWVMSTMPMGFQLKLDDFHRDFYPGSTEAKTFESWLELTHPTKYPQGQDILIDMNHPLRLDGWRLYQQRFAAARGKMGDMTTLQVNRDPGLVVTYSACGLLTLGLVVVFFQKPFLRRLAQTMKRRRASPLASTAAGAGVVFFGGLSTVPGALLIGLMNEGAILIVGVFAVVAGLVLETVLLNTVIARRVAPPETDSTDSNPSPTAG